MAAILDFNKSQIMKRKKHSRLKKIMTIQNYKVWVWRHQLETNSSICTFVMYIWDT